MSCLGVVFVVLLVILFSAIWPTIGAVILVAVCIGWLAKVFGGNDGKYTPSGPGKPLAPIHTQASKLQSALREGAPTETPKAPTTTISIAPAINRVTKHRSGRDFGQLQWTGSGDSLVIGEWRLADPMTYWTPRMADTYEASCIEMGLSVGRPVSEPRGALGYYPRYENMSPAQRANYLEWLASGRSAPLEDIGYAFVFFYGLERRVLVDGSDIEAIVPEVIRLLSRYRQSGSFNHYLSSFLAYTLASTGLRNLPDEWFDAILDADILRHSEHLPEVCMARLGCRDGVLTADWAFEMMRCDPRASRSVVLQRAPEQFKSLFAHKYHERFGQGFELPRTKSKCEISYRPASPSLLELTWNQTCWPSRLKIPNAVGNRSCLDGVLETWADSIRELRAYSRVIAQGAASDSREAYEALPEELKIHEDHPDAPKWEEVFSAHVRDDGLAIVAVAVLASLCGIEERPKLTTKMSQTVASTSQRAGFAVVPDMRIVERPYAWGDQVALMRAETQGGPPIDSEYRAAACILELGMIVASADGDVGNDEVDRIELFLADGFGLSPEYATRLRVYGRLLAQRPPKLAQTAKLLRSVLPPEEHQSVATFIVGVAAANGTITRAEVATLRRMFKSLEFSSVDLDQVLSGLSSTARQPVQIQSGDTDHDGREPIPIRAHGSDEIHIDGAALARVMAETSQVSRILGEVFAEQDASDAHFSDQLNDREDMAASSDVDLPFDAAILNSLDQRLHPILGQLILKERWSCDELRELALEHNLMPSALVDAINTWSDENLGDFLIDESESLVVNLQLVK